MMKRPAIFQSYFLFMVSLLILPVFLLVFPVPARGSEVDPPAVTTGGISIFPYFSYAPETGLAGGCSLFFLSEASEPKVSLTAGDFIYTEKNQIINNWTVNQYYQEGGAILYAKVNLNRYPNQFYGIGPDTPATLVEDYTLREISFKGSYRVRVFDNFYLGPWIQYARFDTEDLKDGGLLDAGEIVGSHGTTVAGVGCHLTWDFRDHEFYPENGTLTDIKAVIFSRKLGSSEDFANVTLDFRQYLPVAPEQILAFQEYLCWNSGQTPFEMMAPLGGPCMMRGFVAGRYLDKCYFALQGEYRFPIVWRFSGVLFASAGEVGPALENLSLQNLRSAGGLGLRYAINESQKLNLRFDAGYSPEDGIRFYISGTEAF